MFFGLLDFLLVFVWDLGLVWGDFCCFLFFFFSFFFKKKMVALGFIAISLQPVSGQCLSDKIY